MKLKTNKMLLALGATLGLAASANAAITAVHTYDLGEAGSITSGLIQDSTGTSHFTSAIAGGPTSETTGVGAPGSTAYASFAGTRSNYGADFSALATDNFAIEMWVRTSNTAQANNSFFVTHDGANAVKFQVEGGNWAASIDGAAWIGAANGAGQTISANTWTHLAVIRNNGTSTFYIDGLAQAGTAGNGVTHSANGHIGVTPGGVSYFDGDMDAVRVFTFDPNTDDPVAALNLVPEPSSTALLGLGGLALLLRRKK